MHLSVLLIHYDVCAHLDAQVQLQITEQVLGEFDQKAREGAPSSMEELRAEFERIKVRSGCSNYVLA